MSAESTHEHDSEWYAAQRSLPLDPSLYALRADEAEFYKRQTGITDDGELRAHILGVQARAYELCPYPCIRLLAFTKLKISRFPVYEDVLRLGRERPGAVLLDLGCCFGNDARKAVADGFPASQVIASDLRGEFWALGHALFRDSSPETCGIRFVAGDVFSPSFIDESPEPQETPTTDPIAACVASNSLRPLARRVSALHASALFHLFSAPQQLLLARKCNALLSAEPGSLIFGSHRGGVRAGRDSFTHDAESWAAMWREAVPEGTVRVEAHLREADDEAAGAGGGAVDENGVPRMWLVWVVRRV